MSNATPLPAPELIDRHDLAKMLAVGVRTTDRMGDLMPSVLRRIFRRNTDERSLPAKTLST